MKSHLSVALSLLVLLSLAAPAITAQEAQKRPQIKVEKVEVDDIQSPDYNATSQPEDTDREDWLKISVIYESEGGEDGWLDNVRFKWYVLLLNGRTPKMMTTADVTYNDVESGEEHEAAVFMRPKTIKRHYDDSGNVSKRDLLLHVEVTVDNFQVAAFDYPRRRANVPDQWWQNPTVNRVKHGLLPRDRTPFAPLEWDSYEFIVPENQ